MTFEPDLAALMRRLKLGQLLPTLPDRLALARAQQLAAERSLRRRALHAGLALPSVYHNGPRRGQRGPATKPEGQEAKSSEEAGASQPPSRRGREFNDGQHSSRRGFFEFRLRSVSFVMFRGGFFFRRGDGRKTVCLFF